MSSESQSRQEEKFRPQAQLDEALQRELDEALGGMSLEDMIEAEEKTGRGARKDGEPGASPAQQKIRKGTVISIQGDDIFIDVGGKSQGVLSASAFGENDPLPAEGQQIDVTIEGFDGSNGLLVLSREGAVMAAAWETITEGQTVEGRVTGLNKGGLELTVNGIRAFMPISQVEMFRVEDLTPYLNQRLTAQVIEVKRDEQNLVISRRALLEFEAQESREKTFATLVEGATVRGVVKNIMPYGAFVDIGGMDGLLHVKDMSHGRVEDPNTIVKQGQTLELMVLKIDKESRKIALGLKQVLPDPWAEVEGKYAVGAVVSGRITRLAEFGAFLELEPGVEGLIPIGELSFERRIKHPSEVVNVGDVSRVRVMSIEKDRKRISLSLKKAGEDPWLGASVRWQTGSVHQGVVKRLADFGAFVELTPGVEGLVHISELSDERVRTVADAVQEGQLVQVKVLVVEEDRRRISLSIKQSAASAVALAGGEYSTSSAAHAEQAPEEEAKPQPKRKTPLKGGLD